MLLWTTQVVRTQSMETWGIWYINEGFLWCINHMNLPTELVQLVLSHPLSHHFMSYSCSDVYAHDTVLTHAFDSDLSIHVCLSLHATWHSSHHSLGSFWLPWTCMFRFRSLKLIDSLSCWSEMHSGSVDHRQTVQSPFLPGPLLGSRVFFL